MKIGIITSSLDNRNGWGRYSLNVISALQTAGVECRVASSDGGSRGEDIARIQPILGRGIENIFTLPADIFNLRKTFADVDLVHTFTEPEIFLAAFLGKPYIVSTHGTYAVRYLQKPITRPIARYAFEHAAGIVCTSEFTCQKMSRYCRLPRKLSIPNGVDTSSFTLTGQLEAAPILVTVGEVKERKGQDIGVQAVQILKQRYPDIHYYIVGNDQTGFATDLKRQVHDLGLDSNVMFTGPVSESGLKDYYHRSRVFLLPSRVQQNSFEGYPLSIMEGNACGLPAVGTYGCGAEHFIVPGENGELVQPEDAQGLAGAIDRIISDPERYRSMSVAARRVAQEHSWTRNAEQLVAFYAKILQS